MTRAMVTGATTQLGVATISELLRAGTEHVVAVGREDCEQDFVGRFGTGRVSYVRTDLGRSRSIRTLMFGPVRDQRVDTIVHGPLRRAASGNGRAEHTLNVESSRLMLRLAEDLKIPRFVFRSRAEVYSVRADAPTVIREDHALNLDPKAPQWIRDRVESDLTVCAATGLGTVKVAVLRCAEIFGPGVGSQLWDYLQAPVCLQAMGYDPMLNLLSVEDAARAIAIAAQAEDVGVFNIRGVDTLPLSEAVRRAGRPVLPVPGPLMGPLYRLRRFTVGTDFRYDLNQWRFHFSAILDGERAKRDLGFEPQVRVRWPVQR